MLQTKNWIFLLLKPFAMLSKNVLAPPSLSVLVMNAGRKIDIVEGFIE